MGQGRVQEDPRVDGRQIETDARGFRAAGGKRAYIHQMRLGLRGSRGLRSDGMQCANNAYYSGSYLRTMTVSVVERLGFMAVSRKFNVLIFPQRSSRYKFQEIVWCQNVVPWSLHFVHCIALCVILRQYWKLYFLPLYFIILYNYSFYTHMYFLLCIYMPFREFV